MINWLKLIRLFREITKKHVSQKQDKFNQEAREQFLKLKEKGLSIPVFTL